MLVSIVERLHPRSTIPALRVAFAAPGASYLPEARRRQKNPNSYIDQIFVSCKNRIVEIVFAR